MKKPDIFILLKRDKDFFPSIKQLLAFILININNAVVSVFQAVIAAFSINHILLLKNGNLFLNSFLMLILSGVFKMVIGFLSSWFTAGFIINKSKAIKEKYYQNFLKELRYQNMRNEADLSISIERDVEIIVRYLVKFIEKTMRLSLILPLSVILLILFNPLILLIILPVILSELLVTVIFSRKLSSLNKEIRSNLSSINLFLKDSFMKRSLITITGTIPFLKEKFSELLKEKRINDFKRYWLGRSEWLMVNIFSYSARALLFYYLGFSAINNKITPGEILFLLMLLNLSTESFRELFFLYKDARVFDEPSIRLKLINPQKNIEKTILQELSVLEFKSVSFSYQDKKILNNLSFILKAGELSVITGKSGVGKTTIFRLITGLLDQDKGDIIINGSKLSRNERLSYARSFISPVFQENIIFRMNFSDNILLGRNQAELEQLMHKFNLIYQDKDIFIGDNIVLSGGEQRKLSIMRALIESREKVLLMDEPFTGIDEASFTDLLSEMRQRANTIIIFTHEKRILEKADNIIDLDLQSGR